MSFHFAEVLMLISGITFIGCNTHSVFLLYVQYKHSH